jgi:hypothetical protein
MCGPFRLPRRRRDHSGAAARARPTTGAGIWVVGAIGIDCGFGLFVLAVVVTLIALTMLGGRGWPEPAPVDRGSLGAAPRDSAATASSSGCGCGCSATSRGWERPVRADLDGIPILRAARYRQRAAFPRAASLSALAAAFGCIPI